MITSKIPCTVEILTLNSAQTVGRCLKSVSDFDDIIVLDGNSTDETLVIAREFGARIYAQAETNEKNFCIQDFAMVRNKGIGLARYKWFLYIDSDEYLSSDAVSEIKSIIEHGDRNQYFVYKLPRLLVCEGKIITSCSMYPNYQVRFFNLNAVEGFRKKIHERIIVKEGFSVGELAHPEYVPYDNIAKLRKKWDRYLDIQIGLYGQLNIKIWMRIVIINSRQFLAYCIRYALTFLKTNKGSRLPWRYEFYSAYYHIDLIRKVTGVYLRDLMH